MFGVADTRLSVPSCLSLTAAARRRKPLDSTPSFPPRGKHILMTAKLFLTHPCSILCAHYHIPPIDDLFTSDTEQLDHAGRRDLERVSTFEHTCRMAIMYSTQSSPRTARGTGCWAWAIRGRGRGRGGSCAGGGRTCGCTKRVLDHDGEVHDLWRERAPLKELERVENLLSVRVTERDVRNAAVSVLVLTNGNRVVSSKAKTVMQTKAWCPGTIAHQSSTDIFVAYTGRGLTTSRHCFSGVRINPRWVLSGVFSLSSLPFHCKLAGAHVTKCKGPTNDTRITSSVPYT